MTWLCGVERCALSSSSTSVEGHLDSPHFPGLGEGLDGEEAGLPRSVLRSGVVGEEALHALRSIPERAEPSSCQDAIGLTMLSRSARKA